MKPWGAVIRITKNFKQIAKFEDMAALDAYCGSPEFKRLIALAADHYTTIMRAYEQAKAQCLQRKPVPAAGTRRAQWDARMLERLQASWSKHSGLPFKVAVHRVARDLNITEGAADTAIRSRTDAFATQGGQKKPSRNVQDGRLQSGGHVAASQKNDSASLGQEAA